MVRATYEALKLIQKAIKTSRRHAKRDPYPEVSSNRTETASTIV
jgi:hypothetical protein